MVDTRSQKKYIRVSNDRLNRMKSARNSDVAIGDSRDDPHNSKKSSPLESTSQVPLTRQHSPQAQTTHYIHPLQSDSQTTEILRRGLSGKLQSRQFPKTICPSEIPRALSRSDLASTGLSDWRQLMPQVRSMLFDMRAKGEVEILQKGRVISTSTTLDDVHGPIRARLVPKDGV